MNTIDQLVAEFRAKRDAIDTILSGIESYRQIEEGKKAEAGSQAAEPRRGRPLKTAVPPSPQPSPPGEGAGTGTRTGVTAAVRKGLALFAGKQFTTEEFMRCRLMLGVNREAVSKTLSSMAARGEVEIVGREAGRTTWRTGARTMPYEERKKALGLDEGKIQVPRDPIDIE